METKLHEYAEEENICLSDLSFLVSFSGGIDSTIMCLIVSEVKRNYGCRVGFVHINHHAHINSMKSERFCILI